MGTLPRKIHPERIIGYVVVHEKVFLSYPNEEKEMHEIILTLAVEDDKDKENLLALAEIFQKGYRSGSIRNPEGGFPIFDVDTPSNQRKSLQILLEHMMDNMDDQFAQDIVVPLIGTFLAKKPTYLSKEKIHEMNNRMKQKRR